MSQRTYPESVVEVLDDQMTSPSAVLRAVQQFARARPWRGTVEERKAKFRTLNYDLAGAYGIFDPDLSFGIINGSSSGSSHYCPSQHQIVLVGRLSVVTFLHEFAHSMDMGERDACRWSINLFRRCFPKEYSRLIHVGHTLVRPEDLPSGFNGDVHREHFLGRFASTSSRKRKHFDRLFARCVSTLRSKESASSTHVKAYAREGNSRDEQCIAHVRISAIRRVVVFCQIFSRGIFGEGKSKQRKRVSDLG